MTYFRASTSTVKTIFVTLMASVFLLPVIPQQAAAFDLFGIHLWGKKKKDEKADTISEPKYYNVEVVAAPGASEEGVKIVKASSSLISQKDKPASGSAGLLARARGDYRRILAALYSSGRYGGVVSIRINGKETADIPSDSRLPDRVAIIITIDSGPQYRFGLATIHELAPPENNRKNRVPLPQNSGYKTGDAAESGVILEAEKLAIDGWRQQGYAKAQIIRRDIVADHAARTVNADIRVDPGLLTRFGNLAVRNVSRRPRMDSAYVAWMTNLRPGQRYDPDALANANKRLSRLGVFRAATINEADTVKPDGSLPLSLVLQERKPRRFGVGAAYSTLDGAGFEGYWLHRNLFGRAESLRFDSRISNIGGNNSKSYNPQNYSYLLGTTFIRPGVFTPNMDYIANMKGEREVLEHYTSTGVYLRTGFTHMLTDELSYYLYLNATHVKTKDDYFGDRRFTTLGFLGGLLYDSRDDKVDAHRGFYGELVAEPFYEAEYDNFINKITIEGRTYLPLDSQDRFVVAVRGKVGFIVGAETSELPSNMLFFAGGGGSVRGYAYRNIGVRTATGDVIGGRSLTEGTAEFRTMITQSLGIVSFVDAGVVGDDIYPDFHEDAKIGAGLGVRYKTGLGPLRFDVALPLNRAKGDPSFSFYIGIGQAF